MSAVPVVADAAMVRLYGLVERLGPADLPVLILGETGCGKELIATAIHARSHRSSKPLISVNCAALHEMLAASELFGHEKGAFSGAVAARAGLIEAASGSTLFLDEVGELTLSVQAKLLRVLEAHCLTRIGDTRQREVDVRIVSATNRDLEADVATGRFRRDLYFRLSGATLNLPPLRMRPSEVLPLATSFLDEACQSGGRTRMRISEGALATLRTRAWPGNIRELKNLMQYVAAAVPADIVQAEHVVDRLGLEPCPPAVGAEISVGGEVRRFRPLAEEIRELEAARMREALDATHGNRTRAALLLAMPARTFFAKAKQHRLSPRKKTEPRS